MARGIKVTLNHANIRKLLRSAEVQRDLTARGERIAAKAGPGHEVQTTIGRNRARVTVRTVTDEAKLAQEKNGNLTKAIEAGR